MLENFIDKHLEKQGFMRVPITWSNDYRELVEKKSSVDRLVRELAREYNVLLRELATEKPIAWLKETLKELDVDIKGLNKEELIDLYVETYEVSFEDDTEEEIK